ncbi:MAG: beta-ketoacyl synthase N-terminal-like domain-containing protein, partial [Myxococcota bacterium]
MSTKESNSRALAVVAVGAMFPGSRTIAEYWRDIVQGTDRIKEVPKTHWLARDYVSNQPNAIDKIPNSRGAYLDTVDFPPIDFGIIPNAVEATDSSHLLGLLVAKQVLDDMAGPFQAVDKARTGVIVGVASTTELVAHMASRLQIPVWKRALEREGLDAAAVDRVISTMQGVYTPWQENTFPGLLGNVVSGRIASRFDLGGPNAVVDAACASSLAAVEIAANQLDRGQIDLAITGGVDALNDIVMFMCFGQTGALSRSGDARPFSTDADGTVLGEGLGLMALKRLDDAERHGDRIYAVLRGIGSSSDGRAKSIYAPRPEGQALAIARAYEEAGYSPASVELVEAHGTGTVAGDLAELTSTGRVFSEGGAARRSVAIGSVKAQIGH